VSPPEVLAIAHYIKSTFSPEQNQELQTNLNLHLEKSKSQSPLDQILDTAMCPLLKNAECTVYPHRPTTCQTYHSFNLESCIQDFSRTKTAIVPQDPDRINLSAIYMIALEV